MKSNFRYDEHGGFGLSVEQCNGVGGCRRLARDHVPRLHGDKDEDASTRGRANVLKSLTGQLGEDGLTDQGVMDAMELACPARRARLSAPTQ